MSLEAFKKRLKELEVAKDQGIANVNAIAGAIQECQFWISTMTKPEEIPETKSELKIVKPVE